MLLSVKQLRASRIPKQLGVCDDDPRLLQWFNEFQEAALNQGRWWGTYQTSEFCTYGGLVAFPRVVACVEQITLGGWTIDSKNQWYGMMSVVSQPKTCLSCGCGGGVSGRNDCGACGSRVWEDVGTMPTFRQIHGARYIKLYPRSASDVGKRVLVQGRDENREWVRKQYGGIWVEGEYVTIGNPFGISTTLWTSITGIQKDVTDKNVKGYALNPTNNIEEFIAEWQPDEVNPAYRTIKLPCLCSRCDNRPAAIKALVKLDHVDVSQDTDWLILQNLVAIEHGMRSRMLYERNQDVAADKEFVRALSLLNNELRTKTGDRVEFFVDIGCESFRDDLNGFQ